MNDEQVQELLQELTSIALELRLIRETLQRPLIVHVSNDGHRMLTVDVAR
jgi:hypothetical protein